MSKKSIIKKTVVTENFGRKKVSANFDIEQYDGSFIAETDCPECAYPNVAISGHAAGCSKNLTEPLEEPLEETPKELTYEIGDVVFENEVEVWNEPEAGAPEVQPETALERFDVVDSTAVLLSDAGETAIAKIAQNMNVANELRTLTEDEEKDFAECEQKIENGIRSYLTMGEQFFRIHLNGYFLKTHKTFGEYVFDRWKFKGGGALDLIRSYRTWQMMKDLPAVPEPVGLLQSAGDVPEPTPSEAPTEPTEVLTAEPVFEPLADTEAPSQRAIDELAKFKKHLERGEMSEAEFEKWIAVATRSLFDFIRETTEGEITQKRIAEVTEALIGIVHQKAVEIDGEHRQINAAEIQITREQFESVMREKQTLFEYFEEKRRRLSEPKTRDDLDEKKIQKKTLTTICSEHGEQPIYAILHGAVQVFCGCVFGHSSKSNRMIFDKRLTETNEIAVLEREAFYVKLNQ